MFNHWYLVIFFVLNGQPGTYVVEEPIFKSSQECVVYSQKLLLEFDDYTIYGKIPESYINGVCLNRVFSKISDG